MKKLFPLFLLVHGILFTLPVKSYAQIETYIEVGGSYTTILSKAFNGESILEALSEKCLVPKLSGGGMGFGVTLGLTNPEHKFYCGFKYSRSTFDASFQNESLGKARYHVFGLLDFTWYFPDSWETYNRDRSRIQFYLSGVIEAGVLRVNDSWSSIDNSKGPDAEWEIGNASYSWMGIPVETGISLNFMQASSLKLGVGYRLATATSAKEFGTVDPGTGIGDKLGASGYYFEFGLIIPLKFKRD
jgi:hypothetical protein